MNENEIEPAYKHIHRWYYKDQMRYIGLAEIVKDNRLLKMWKEA